MEPTDYWGVAGAILVSVGGGGAIVLALSSWLGKVWASRILEAERSRHAADLEQVKASYAAELEHFRAELELARRILQVQLDRTLHIHRLQFEAEFAALKEIWSKLSLVRGRMGVVRPTLRAFKEDETEEDYLNEKFPMFVGSKNEFMTAVHAQSPFIPQNVYDKLIEIVDVLNREWNDVAIKREHDADWYERGRTNFERVVALADEVSALIRARLQSLVVISD